MPKIITIAHTKGGVGKSTLAWNIATALKARGLAVEVFDLDFQKTLFFVDRLRITDPLAPLPAMGVVSLAAGTTLAAAVQSSRAEYIIIDVGGFDSELNREAINLADMVICPVRDSITEALGFHAFSAVLATIGSPRVHLVFNGAHPKTADFVSLRDSFGDYPALSWLDSVVRFRAAFARTMSRGRGVVEAEGSWVTKAADDVRALAAEILEVCDGKAKA
jgi:chromosome partitioning protein